MAFKYNRYIIVKSVPFAECSLAKGLVELEREERGEEAAQIKQEQFNKNQSLVWE